MNEEPLLKEKQLKIRCVDGAEHESEFAVYAIRWWVLALVSLLALLQGGYWINYGPIAPALQPCFGWSNAQISLLANWGTAGWFISVAPFSWLMDHRGKAWKTMHFLYELKPSAIEHCWLCISRLATRCYSGSSLGFQWRSVTLFDRGIADCHVLIEHKRTVEWSCWALRVQVIQYLSTCKEINACDIMLHVLMRMNTTH
jgi:hypothetical protein